MAPLKIYFKKIKSGTFKIDVPLPTKVSNFSIMLCIICLFRQIVNYFFMEIVNSYNFSITLKILFMSYYTVI